ncbi:MAG: transporter substrate-binding domain-containing protein [Oscillospiraceae bacterium]|nr:transporter substrate-binding domain-containing protein [Oscillospiraceae bacterium]
MKKVSLLVLLSVVLLLLGCASNQMPPNSVHSPEDLYGGLIGVLEGTSGFQFAERMGVASQFPNGEELLAALRSGSVDAVVMERATAEIVTSRARRVTMLAEPLIAYDLRIAVAKENTNLLAAVNSALASLRADGVLDALRDGYFIGADFAYTPPETAATRPGYLRVAVPRNFPPYAFEDDYGNLAGMSVDIARAVVDIIGVELVIVEFDVHELVTAVWFGRTDLALGFIPNDRDDELVNFSSVYAQSTQAIIVRR